MNNVSAVSQCGSALVEEQVHEHGVLKGLPGEIWIGDGAHGTLGDAGMGWAEALECGSPAEAACLFDAAAQAPAQQLGSARNPGALEGVDGDAGGIAEDGVVESEGF